MNEEDAEDAVNEAVPPLIAEFKQFVRENENALGKMKMLLLEMELLKYMTRYNGQLCFLVISSWEGTVAKKFENMQKRMTT